MTKVSSKNQVIKTYTLLEINKAWDAYKNGMGWRLLLQGGKKKFVFKAPDFANEQPVRCDMMRVEAVMEFPEFLETTWQS